MAQLARRDGIWPAALVAEHEARYGPGFKAEQRARNALFFAEQLVRGGVAHFHVHFARNAAHTATFREGNQQNRLQLHGTRAGLHG